MTRKVRLNRIFKRYYDYVIIEMLHRLVSALEQPLELNAVFLAHTKRQFT